MLRFNLKGLLWEYLVEVAEYAIHAEENAEKIFNFCIYLDKANLRQYEIKTKRTGNAINISWRIADATVTFKAQREITIHARRRRSRWRRSRRRCHTYKAPRGVTKMEIVKIKNTLTTVVNSRGVNYSRHRYRRDASQPQCPLTNPYKKPPYGSCMLYRDKRTCPLFQTTFAAKYKKLMAKLKLALKKRPN